MKNKKLSYCDFCVYKVYSGCSAKPNSTYCTEAKNEYWQYINNKKHVPVKSLKKWDKK